MLLGSERRGTLAGWRQRGIVRGEVDEQSPILEGLNPPQQQAVRQIDGPVLVIAGAGSGKTRVITRRVAWMIDQGIPPWSIVAITFTNKAAGEMRKRVADAMGRPLRDFGRLVHDSPTICTFHSLCLRILKYYAETIGLQRNFSILDVSDQQKVVKQALEACKLDPKRFSPSQSHGMISTAKNKLITPEMYAQSAGFVEKQFAPVYAKYQQLLKQNNAVDFDDLLMMTALTFRKHKAILDELSQRFGYLLIDEYQDTNHAQYIIAHALVMKHRNICVVGYPDQSIYAWRGADIRNILDFEQDYPDAVVVRLEQNYRSSKRILEIASQLIKRNVERKDKTLWTQNAEGEKATLLVCADERDEAQQVTQQIKSLHDQQKINWSQMALFYRINAMSRVMEDALRRNGVPYEIARGVEFYNRKEIKDVLAYLRVMVNPLDEVSLERIINTPTRGIGDNSVRLMQAYATANQLALIDVLGRAAQMQGLSKKAAASAANLATLFERWRGLAGITQTAELATSVQAIIETVVRESGLEDHYKKEGEEDIEGSPIDNINELISSAAEFDDENPEASLETYLHQVSLVSDADHRGHEGAVTLMTLHAAKGLEFPVVAIIGLEEGILPHERVKDDPSQLEEERRLCFVGVTRAQQHLILSRAQSRAYRGMIQRQVASPFLREMPQGQIQMIQSPAMEIIGEGRSAWRQQSDESQVPAEPKLRRGQRVQHPAHGQGTVVDVSTMGPDTRVVIDFAKAGRKTLILEYTRLTVVG